MPVTSWRLCLGAQLDVHAPAATVREALLFSGRLRFETGVDDATVQAFVAEVRRCCSRLRRVDCVPSRC